MYRRADDRIIIIFSVFILRYVTARDILNLTLYKGGKR